MYNFGSFDAFIVKPTILPEICSTSVTYRSQKGLKRIFKKRGHPERFGCDFYYSYTHRYRHNSNTRMGTIYEQINSFEN